MLNQSVSRCVLGAFAVAAMLWMSAPQAQASGVLDGNVFAVTYPTFSGSSSFSSGPMSGDVEYAVFTAAEFTAAFPTSPYAPADAAVYAYELHNTGDPALSAEIVGITNPASAIGSFLDTAGQIAPSSESFVGTDATWLFESPAIATGESSYILVFSSPNAPQMGLSLTIDGGTAALASVPTPGTEAVPEPASVALLAGGGLALVMRRRR